MKSESFKCINIITHNVRERRSATRAGTTHDQAGVTTEDIASKLGIQSRVKDWIAYGSRLVYLCTASESPLHTLLLTEWKASPYLLILLAALHLKRYITRDAKFDTIKGLVLELAIDRGEC